MQIIENLKVKEKLYIEKLENGLTVMIIPRKGIQKKYVIIGTHFGSVDNCFIVPGEKEPTKIPDGVAHYLEHKMFEQANGINSLDALSSIGADANAYTTNDHTAYLFETTENFYEALDELMDYVQNPYFTDENVEKEKGIISQEIKMYEDHPGWQVYLNTVKCLYKENPVRNDIAGTVESISEINKEILYKCYNTFYNPANMAMVICGDFVPEEILEEVKKRLIKKENISEIKRIYPEESKEINKKQKKVKMEVNNPLFSIGFKDEITQKEEAVKKHIAIEILLKMILGESSKLYLDLYKQGLLLSEPELDYEFSKQYAFVLITGQSKEPEKVIEAVKKQIKKLKDEDLDEKVFSRIKKRIYGDYITEYNSISNIAKMFLADYFKGINSFDYLEEYSQVTKEYTKQILEDVFNEETMAISIVEANDNE